MAFDDYESLAQVQQEFAVKYREENFIPARRLEPPPFFLKELAFNLTAIDVYTSEVARTEAVIFPILREVYKKYHQQYALWIQKYISYNAKLSGTPDYLIATQSPLGKTILEKPLVVLVEAKKNDFEQGWGQCLAELIAAQNINGTPERAVYGVVTDGKLWEIGKLTGDIFTKNIASRTVDDLPELFGALDFIMGNADNSLTGKENGQTQENFA